MNYLDTINTKLVPQSDRDLNLHVLDLFAGCGGLSLGFEANGFKTTGYEMNSIASDTYNKNLLGHCYNTELNLNQDYPSADIIIGGPPCQPFSVRGNQNGLKDSRDGFPVFIDAVTKVKPELWLFENVRGMLYRNREYLDEIIESLSEQGYHVYFQLMNARNYWVPQNRERVIVIGSKKQFGFPKKKESTFTVEDAIGDLIDQPFDQKYLLTDSMDKYIKKYEVASKCVNPRDLWLDRPARTLTCRNLAGATSDMQRLRIQNGKRRMLLPNEAARLQSFPDWFQFEGTNSEIFKQIGNAVAPMFSYHLAKQIKKYFVDDGLRETNSNYNKQLAIF